MQLHVTSLGHGPQALLAFHGIGQTGDECFHEFAAQLGHLYTIYAFDLPFHGRSTSFEEELPFTKESLHQFVHSFLQTQHIERFSVVGFSIGSRFAVSLAASFQTRLNDLFLIAPDGIYPHPLYKVATSTLLSRLLFKWVLRHPSALFLPAKFLTKVDIYPSSMHRFLVKMLETPQKRDQIYKAWTAYRKLYTTPTSLAATQLTHLHIFLAQYDYLIPATSFKKLQQLIPSARIITFPVSHFGVVHHAGKYLANNI